MSAEDTSKRNNQSMSASDLTESERNTAQFLADHRAVQSSSQNNNSFDVANQSSNVTHPNDFERNNSSPSSEGSSKNIFVSMFDKTLAFAKGFAVRVIIHISSFFSAGLMVSFFPTLKGLAVYIGLICLIARDTHLGLNWLVPAGIGLLQMILCTWLGIPFVEAIFWGGAQAWVQRLFMKNFRMGFEWIPLAFIVPLSLRLSFSLVNVIFFLATFAILTAGGYVFWMMKRKYFTAQDDSTIEVEGREVNSNRSITSNFLSDANKSDPFSEHLESITKLRTKKPLLPSDMQMTLNTLMRSANSIILCMRDDNREIEQGEKFLRRYLPATHSVLDKYCRLSGNAINNFTVSDDINEALKESKNILQRLEQAFTHEHKRLLRNDIDDFSADLRVLDTLLKMEGR